MKALLEWLDHRTGYKLLVHEALNEPIPGGARFRYAPGSMLTFVFMIQVVTGFFLWSAYSPSTLTAWESVYYIQYVMEYGSVVRGIHAFAAQMMVVLMVVHFLQVIWDKAYIAPREVNFWLGLVLMQIVLGLALTGYLLPWDQKGYYATRVATNIAGSAPFVGQEIQEMVQGGTSYGHHTLTRFFALHAGVLPSLLVVFLALHVYVFRRHGITTPDPKAPPATFWPGQVLKDAIACLIVLGVILYLVRTKGAELSAPADPGEEYPARPEWYFLFLFRFLKFELIAEWGKQLGAGEALGAIYIPGAAMGIIALMPFIGKTKIGHRFNLLYTLLLILFAGGLTGMAMREDKDDQEFQAKLKFAERDAHRVVELAQREQIPPLGARELLVNDAYTQGPRLFARHCSGCHHYHSHDATGIVKMMEDKTAPEPKKAKKLPEPATAADLGNFGSREWIQAVLVDYHNVFQPIAKSVQAPTEKMDEKQRAALDKLNEQKESFLKGDMANWSESNKAKLQDAANAESLKALVEFLVAQSGSEHAGTVDEKLVQQGREIFKSGALVNGSIDACADCHGMKPVGAEEELSSDNDETPTLTGYAGKKWLTEFLKNPGDDDFYGKKNLMPAFEAMLTEKEMELLVDWMTGDYYRGPNHEQHAHGK